MMRDYLGEIASDPSASDWVRARALELRERDCVDAANDAEVLALAARRQADAVFMRNETRRFLKL